MKVSPSRITIFLGCIQTQNVYCKCTECDYQTKIKNPTQFLLLIVAVIPHATADSINPGVFSINSKPYGSTYGQWSSKWWQWLAHIPSSINPINDKTGANCAQGQNGPVWFLAGSTGRQAVRDCSMPAGRAILFPALTSECSYAEDSTLKTETQMPFLCHEFR